MKILDIVDSFHDGKNRVSRGLCRVRSFVSQCGTTVLLTDLGNKNDGQSLTNAVETFIDSLFRQGLVLEPAIFIEHYERQTYISSVKDIFKLFLLVSAMVGLFGQDIAYASAPMQLRKVGISTVSAMSPDCAADMAAKKSVSSNSPCKGITLSCVAAMGCLPPVFVDEAKALADPFIILSDTIFWTTTNPLVSGTVAPEDHPPSLLD